MIGWPLGEEEDEVYKTHFLCPRFMGNWRVNIGMDYGWCQALFSADECYDPKVCS